MVETNGTILELESIHSALVTMWIQLTLAHIHTHKG